MQSALALIDNKRSKLEPLFIQEDSTELQIAKAERGERLIEALRTEIVGLQETTKAKNVTATVSKQKVALLALADIGELLVPSFPFDVPNEGKFAFLPRLLGRCRVTFSFKRGNTALGNITIIADGFAAPITAGNFVDLSARQFYTGLPIKQVQKKLGSSPYFMPYQFLGIESL
jgi:peptidylprolyl isomerase